MPHLRERYLTSLIKTTLKASSIVGVVGHRQTGKTTLLEQLCAEYSTFDDELHLKLAQADPRGYLANRTSPFGIDECQLAPEIFSALKEEVRVNKKMGRFLISGSVRFTAIEDIKESLTGRIIDLELLPMGITEANHLPSSDLSELFTTSDPLVTLKARPLLKKPWQAWAHEYCIKGGLPGICFLRSKSLRVRKLRSHLKTVLDRDLRLVTKTRVDLRTLKRLAEELATQQGEKLEIDLLSRKIGIARNTLRRILSGLEAIFLIRQVALIGDLSGTVTFWEDQGVATFLQEERGVVADSTLSTSIDMIRVLWSQIHQQVAYAIDHQIQIAQYRTRGGAYLPLALQLGGRWVGFSLCDGPTPTAKVIRSAKSFQQSYPKSRVYLLTLGKDFRSLGDELFEVPLGAVL